MAGVVIDLDGLQRLGIDSRVGDAVAVEIDVDDGVRDRRNPYHAPARDVGVVGAVAEAEADQNLRGQLLGRYQPGTPVEGGAAVVGIDLRDGEEGFLPLGIEVHPRDLADAVGKVNFGAVVDFDEVSLAGIDVEVARIDVALVVVVNGDGAAVRIVEPKPRRSDLLGDRRVVLVRPLGGWGQRVPAHFILFVDIARDELGLDRLVGFDRIALADAIDERLALAQRGGRHRQSGVVLDHDVGIVGACHDVDGGVFEGVGGTVRVLADGNDVSRRPGVRIGHLSGAGEVRAGVLGERSRRYRNRKRRLDAVAAIVIDVAAVAGDRDCVDQVHDVAADKQIVGRPWGNAVGEVAIAPDFGCRLGRLGDVDLVSVFPMVVVDDGAGRSDRDAHGRKEGTLDLVGYRVRLS